MPTIELPNNSGRIQVSVNEAGYFQAVYDEETYSATTLQEVRDKVLKAYRELNARVSRPVTLINLIPNEESRRWGRTEPYVTGIGTVRATLRGKHSGRSEWLFTDENGQKFSIYSTREHICRRLTVAEELEYTRLSMQKERIEQELKEFLKDKWVNPKELMES